MSHGEQVNHILVIEPTTTAWMYQNGSDAKTREHLKEIGDKFQEFLLDWRAAGRVRHRQRGYHCPAWIGGAAKDAGPGFPSASVYEGGGCCRRRLRMLSTGKTAAFDEFAERGMRSVLPRR